MATTRPRICPPPSLRMSHEGCHARGHTTGPREVQVDADRSGRLRPGRTAGRPGPVKGRHPVQTHDLLRSQRSNLAGPEAIQADRSDPDPDQPRDLVAHRGKHPPDLALAALSQDRKSTRLNSSHEWISYA